MKPYAVCWCGHYRDAHQYGEWRCQHCDCCVFIHCHEVSVLSGPPSRMFPLTPVVLRPFVMLLTI